jgi:hypothetical protein
MGGNEMKMMTSLLYLCVSLAHTHTHAVAHAPFMIPRHHRRRIRSRHRIMSAFPPPPDAAAIVVAASARARSVAPENQTPAVRMAAKILFPDNAPLTRSNKRAKSAKTANAAAATNRPPINYALLSEFLGSPFNDTGDGTPLLDPGNHIKRNRYRNNNNNNNHNTDPDPSSSSLSRRGGDPEASIGVGAVVREVGSDVTLTLARGAGILAKTSLIVGMVAGRTGKHGLRHLSVAGEHVKKKIDAKLEEPAVKAKLDKIKAKAADAKEKVNERLKEKAKAAKAALEQKKKKLKLASNSA